MFLKEFSKDRHFNKGARQSQAAGVADKPEKGGKKAQASPGQQGKEKGGKLLRYFLPVFIFIFLFCRWQCGTVCKCCGEVISRPNLLFQQRLGLRNERAATPASRPTRRWSTWSCRTGRNGGRSWLSPPTAARRSGTLLRGSCGFARLRRACELGAAARPERPLKSVSEFTRW